MAGVLTAPVLLVLAATILVRDRQPPLIGLARIGQDGRAFTMWKLRTMRPVVDGPIGAFTLGQDPRVTPLGRRLRRSHLDELPQLWNVVLGEMALLGPRPEAPEYVQPASSEWQATLRVRPGIAGATQIVIYGWESRIGSTDEYLDDVLPRKLEIDLWYIEHASAAVDFDIFRSVLGSMLRDQHRTPVHRRLGRDLPETMAVIAAATHP